MCFSITHKMHHVCLSCRRSCKYPADSYPADVEYKCPECGEPMICAGHDFKPPRRRDKSGWTAVAAVLNAGLVYECFEPCGCGRYPQSLPRTSAQVRARRRLGARNGADESKALVVRGAER
jgi:predicted RNA-binding Zn-ribbon protein involved in translation (DUF1610 family)